MRLERRGTRNEEGAGWAEEEAQPVGGCGGCREMKANGLDLVRDFAAETKRKREAAGIQEKTSVKTKWPGFLRGVSCPSVASAAPVTGKSR